MAMTTPLLTAVTEMHGVAARMPSPVMPHALAVSESYEGVVNQLAGDTRATFRQPVAALGTAMGVSLEVMGVLATTVDVLQSRMEGRDPEWNAREAAREAARDAWLMAEWERRVEERERERAAEREREREAEREREREALMAEWERRMEGRERERAAERAREAEREREREAGREREREAEREEHAILWAIHAHLTLRSAATRIEELVIEKHMSITRDDVKDMKLFSAERCATIVRNWRKEPVGHKPGLPDGLTTAFVDRIDAALPGITKEMATIKADADVAAGIARVKDRGDGVAHSDPGDLPRNWAALGRMADTFCTTPGEQRVVRAMLRQYVALRLAAPTETTHPDPALLVL